MVGLELEGAVKKLNCFFGFIELDIERAERLGIVALAGPQEHALTLVEKKTLLRSRAMDLLRNVA